VSAKHASALRAAPVVARPARPARQVARPTLRPADEIAANEARAYDFLGGARLIKRRPSSRAEVHAMLVDGIPYAVLFHLTSSIRALTEQDVFNVVGISERTLRRQKDAPGKTMPADLASRTWLFAETLAKAAEVFGSREDAERWMSAEVMGLDGARPISLMRTVQGAELVNEFLVRLEHGVYT
jgi:putative toxin-antitoxin system antitoxin component (TIGR02293 family)